MYKKFCCDILSSAMLEPHLSGFSIIPSKIEGQDSFHFVLQFRSHEYGSTKPEKQFIAQKGVSYCPWCGTSMATIASEYKNDISDIASRNEHLLQKFCK